MYTAKPTPPQKKKFPRGISHSFTLMIGADRISDQPFDDLMSALASELLSADADFDKAFAHWLQPIPDPTYPDPKTAPKIFRDNFSTRAWLMNKATPAV